MWTERCHIVMAATQVSHKSQVHARAWEWCLELKRASLRLPAGSRDLLQRDGKFFRTSPIFHVQQRNNRVNTALEFALQVTGGGNEYNDIRKYGHVISRRTLRALNRQDENGNQNETNNNIIENSDDEEVPELSGV